MRRAAALFTVLAAIVHVHAQPAPDNPCVDFDRLYAAIRDAIRICCVSAGDKAPAKAPLKPFARRGSARL